MFPSLSVYYPGDCSLAHIELSCESALGYFPRGKPSANFDNVWFGKFCLAGFCAMHCPPFAYHILRVVFLCAYKVVIGTHAKRVVAFMAKNIALPQLLIGQFPCDAMGEIGFSCNREIAIAFIVEAGSPKPAWGIKNRMDGAVLIDLLPKAFLNRAMGNSMLASIATRARAVLFALSHLAFCGLEFLIATSANEHGGAIIISSHNGILSRVIIPFWSGFSQLRFDDLVVRH